MFANLSKLANNQLLWIIHTAHLPQQFLVTSNSYGLQVHWHGLRIQWSLTMIEPLDQQLYESSAHLLNVEQ